MLSMKETILQIEEYDDYDTEGFKIITSEQVIKISIDSYQNCCEKWGYFSPNDPLSRFIGASITGIEFTDIALDTHILKDLYLDVEDCIFVNIHTDKGVLQFTIYNSHNGYYGHNVCVKSEQLNFEGGL